MELTQPGFGSVRFCLTFALVLIFASVAIGQSNKQSAPKASAAPTAKPAAPASHAPSGGAAHPGGAPGTPGNANSHSGTTGPAGAHPGTTGTAPGAKPGTASAGAKPGGPGGSNGAHSNAGAAGTHPEAAAGGAKPGATGAGGAKPAAAPAKQPGTVNKPGGGTTVTTKSGNTKEFGKSGKMTSVATKNGNAAKFNSSGKVTSIHTKSGATITRGAHGERRVVGDRMNARGEHYRVVNHGRGGYVAHTYTRGGVVYERRTYVYGGVSYAYAYRPYYYGGVAYYGYVPPYYYGPAYYGWAYNPWPAPVYYGWGWAGAPWYGYYGPYFAPAPVYPFAALWLADFLLAENLRLAYEAAAAANGGEAMLSPDYAPYLVKTGATRDGVTSLGGGVEFDADAAAAAMSPEVKQLVADEMKSQIDEEKNAAANSQASKGADAVPGALDPKHTIFVISTTVDVPVGDDSCSLTGGDVVQRQENQPDADKTVAVKVLSSKSNDCAVGSTPRVQVSDLQEAHNDFRQKMDTGLDQLSKGGKGLPTPPDAKKTASPDGQVQPDLGAANDLQAQKADADAAEKDVQAASSESDN